MIDSTSTKRTAVPALTHSSTGWVVVTDLDGTLLDDSYNLHEAAMALNALNESPLDIRCIALASSKTLPEMLLLAELCDESPVLIFENGAGIALPKQYLPDNFSGNFVETGSCAGYGILISGLEYRQVCEVLARARTTRGYAFSGFADMSAEELASRTGLSIAGAELARSRNASEPILWLGSELEFAAFSAELALENLQVVAGGRFLHVSSPHDKAASFSECLRVCAPGARVLACGDAPNDQKLLEQAHHAIVFPDAVNGYLLDASVTISHASAPGGAAWLLGVRRALDSYHSLVEGQRQ